MNSKVPSVLNNNKSPLGVAGAGIFLIGMMGSGKSYWSKRIAEKLKCTAYDLDILIELDEEKTISEIFAKSGEEYFRKTEAKILRWFAEKKTFVLATGGGTPCFHENMQWMKKKGLTIWLDEPIEVLIERLKPEKEHRPLIKNLSDNELADFLLKKLKERKPFYEQCKIRSRNGDFGDLEKLLGIKL